MNKLVSLILLLGSVPCFAVTNSASLVAQSQSLTLGSASGNDSILGPVQTVFTTFDGTSGLPLQINQGRVSGELRPRTGSAGLFETDYFSSFPGVNSEYGWMLFALPTNDADTNGVPDFLQVENAVNATFGNPGSSGRMDYPGTSSFSMNGQFQRNAGELRGIYNLTLSVGGRIINYPTAFWSLLRAEGTADYSREIQNSLRLSFTLTNGIGSSGRFAGSAIYSVPSPNQLVLPQFTLTRTDGRKLILAPMTLTRSGSRYWGNAVAADGELGSSWPDFTRFLIEIVDTHDVNTNGIPDLTDIAQAPDNVAPRVLFTAPVANARVTNDVVVIRGTATDNVGVARVEYTVGTNFFQTATGSNNWSASIPLELGTNLVFVVAYDYRGNFSALAQRRIIRAPTAPLLLTHSSNGLVTPNLNGAQLILGDRYVVTAVPAPRHVFAGWSGSLQSNAARLSFIMQSNLMLHATFVTNPFIAVKGTYVGLFSVPGQPSHDSSGAFRATVTDRGTFTATLRCDRRIYPMAGQFDLEGMATKTIKFQTTNLLTATLHLDLTEGSDQITGTFAVPEWTATLHSFRPPVHGRTAPSPFTGRHTLYFTGSGDGSGPAGNGVATVLVKAEGASTLTGMLGDGIKAMQTASISREGLWPLYIPLYAGKGSISGWLMYTNDSGFSIQGQANWFKPTAPGDRLYPGGFTNAPFVYGAPYSAPQMTNYLSTNTAACLYVSGLGSELLTNCLQLVAKNTYGGPGVKALKLDLATGLWSGTYTNPATGRPLPLKTTLLQSRNLGFGQILSTNLTAGVVFLPIGVSP